jgi:hypothetical protein
MKFYEFSLDYSIHIELRHDPHNDYDNRIIIKGDDFNWVNGTIKKFEEIIDGFSPQNTFVKRNRKILQTIFSLSIGIIYLVVILIPIRLFNGIVGFSTDTDIELSAVGQVLIDFFVKFPIVLYFVKYFLICLLGYFPAKDLIKYLENLWPKVELQFGPEHKLMEKRQRSTVMNVLLIGVVPIILQLIYDVMENILK